MKNFWILLLVFCGLNASSSYGIQHNLFYGHCTSDNDTVPIYTQVISMDNPTANLVATKPVRKWYDSFTSLFRSRRETTPATPVGSVINATAEFPPPGHQNSHLIKCIQVIDNIHDGTGAISSVIDGGMNLNHTKILLKSQPGGKINCKVTIFSYKTEVPAPPVVTAQQTPFGWKESSYKPSPVQPVQPVQHSPPVQPPQQRPHFPWPSKK